MGGIDLCFGRFETHNYPLKDLPYFYDGNNPEYEGRILNNLKKQINKEHNDFPKLKYKRNDLKWFTG